MFDIFFRVSSIISFAYIPRSTIHAYIICLLLALHLIFGATAFASIFKSFQRFSYWRQLPLASLGSSLFIVNLDHSTLLYTYCQGSTIKCPIFRKFKGTCGFHEEPVVRTLLRSKSWGFRFLRLKLALTPFDWNQLKNQTVELVFLKFKTKIKIVIK